MLIFDDLTIIVCAVLVLLAVASALTDTFMRSVPEEDDEAVAEAREPVSVIIIADNNARELDRHLPEFLSQDYAPGYEVIVVVSKDEDGTDDVLKPYLAQHANLRTTFVPDSSRYMSRRKLAVTLGVKAARNELILLTDAECRPDTDRWIQSMASACAASGAGMVMGYCNYEAGTKPFRIFSRLRSEYAFMREAAQGRPYATAGSNLLFRKSMFMEGKGFQGNLKYLRGEYEFLVNKYGAEQGVAVATATDSRMTEDEPTRKTYINKGVFYAETRRHLSRSFRHRLAFNADMLSLHLCLVAAVAAGVFAALTGRWIELGVAVLALVVPFVTRTMTARRAVSRFNASVPAAGVISCELRLVWHNLATAIRHIRADKTDFISHKS